MGRNGDERFLVAIVGPTGSGKSHLAVELAKELDGEVVSCDALQVYRGLSLGTGKVPLSARQGIPHHLLDVVEPDTEFSAAGYARIAAAKVEEIDGRGKLPLVVGGTGLYLRALLYGLFEGPARSPEIRERLRGIASRRAAGFLHRMLFRLDPVQADRIHPRDHMRLIRAVEVRLCSGRRMSDLIKERQSPVSRFRHVIVGLAPERQELRGRIEERVRSMFARGLVEEVRELRSRYGRSCPAFKAIGYREVLRHLDGELPRQEMERIVVRATVQYAKRQMTWFRGEPGVKWFEGFGDDPVVAERAAEYLRAKLEAQEGMRGTKAIGGNALHAKTAS